MALNYSSSNVEGSVIKYLFKFILLVICQFVMIIMPKGMFLSKEEAV